jgi:hypothetical protein
VGSHPRDWTNAPMRASKKSKKNFYGVLFFHKIQSENIIKYSEYSVYQHEEHSIVFLRSSCYCMINYTTGVVN